MLKGNRNIKKFTACMLVFIMSFSTLLPVLAEGTMPDLGALRKTDEWSKPIIIKNISREQGISDKIEIVVSVSAKENTDGVLMLKPINENGRAYRVICEPMEFMVGENEIRIELKFSDYPKGVKEIKTYIWDNLENMKPLAESTQETLEGWEKDWVLKHFVFDGTTITGFSELGEEKVKGDKELILPSTNESGETVVAIANNVFKGKGLTSVKIPDSVTTIGMAAFAQNELTEVELPKQLTDGMGNMAFFGNKLEHIKLNDGLKVISTAAFSQNKLTSVEIPESVTSIAMQAFMENVLEKVNIPLNIKDIGASAFENNNLSTVTIPADVISIGNKAFDGNDDIKLIYTALVEAIDGAKQINTEGNTEESIAALQAAIEAGETVSAKPKATLEEVNEVIEEIQEAIEALEPAPSLDPDFEFSEGVITGYNGTATDVIIPETIDGQEVVAIANNVFKSKGLTSVKIPDSVTTIGMAAFAQNELTEIELPEKLTNGMGNMAFYQNKLTSIKLNDGLTVISTAAFSQNKLTSVEIPESVTSIANQAFKDNELETVNIPLNIKDIGTSTFENNKLGEVTIPVGIVTLGNNAFKGNDDINLVYTALVEAIDRAEQIDTTDKPEEDVGALLEAIDEAKALNDEPYAALQEVNSAVSKINSAIEALIPDFEFSDGTITKYIGAATDVIIPETIDEEEVTKIGDKVFHNKNLTSIIFPNTLEEIGKEAFAGNLIKSLEIPGSVKSIGEGAFLLNQMENLVLNEGLESIDRFAFRDNELTELIIPSSMRELGERAFYKNKISKLTILPGIEKLGAQSFENNVIQELNIPETVKYIDLGAFVYNSLENVELPKGLKILGPKSFGVNNMESIVFPETVEWFCPNAFRKNKGFENGEFKIFIDKIIEMDEDIKESDLKDELSKEIKVRAAVFEGLIDETKHKIDIKLWERIGEEDGHLVYRGKFEEISAEIIKTIEDAEGCGSGSENIVENMQRISLIVKVKLTGELLDPEEPSEPEEPEEPDEPNGEVWDPKYFTFDGTTLMGFSELGQGRFATDKDVVIPEKTAEGETVDSIGDRAFNIDVSFGKDGIKSLILPGTIKSIGAMAFRNNNIVNLKLPDSVEELGDGVFAANRDLETLVLSNNLRSIPDGAFSFNKVKKLIIPEGVTEIGGSAFTDNNLLSDLTIPSTVEKINDRAFMNIVVADLIIPGSVKEIKSSAFSGGALSSLVLEEGIEIIKSDAFKRNKLSEITIPKSVTELYKTAFDLNQNIIIKYASLIEILEEAKGIDTEGKTEESIAVLQSAIEEGETVNAGSNATLDEVNEAVEGIQAAIDGLEEVGYRDTKDY